MSTTLRHGGPARPDTGVHNVTWGDDALTAIEDLLAAVPTGIEAEVAVVGSHVCRVRVGGQDPVDETSNITTTSIRLATSSQRSVVVLDGLSRSPSAVADAIGLAVALLAPATDTGSPPFAAPSTPGPSPRFHHDEPGAWYDPSSATEGAEVRRRLVAAYVTLADHGVTLTKGIGYAGGATALAIGTTGGLRDAHRTSVCHYGTTVLVDGSGSRVALYGFRSARGADALDAEELVLTTARAAGDLAAPATPTLPAGLPVVLEPRVTAEFLHVIGRAAAAPNRYRQRSFLSDRTGDRVGSGLDIIDDPTDSEAVNGALVEGEGAPTRPVGLVRDGVVRHGLTTWSDARELTIPHTASALRPLDGPPRAAARSVRIAAARPEPMPDARVRVVEVRGFSVGSTSKRERSRSSPGASWNVGTIGHRRACSRWQAA